MPKPYSTSKRYETEYSNCTQYSDSTMGNRTYANVLPREVTSDCQNPNPADTLTDRLNTILNSSGPGYVLRLCPNQQYFINAPLLFASPGQEISTAGYPTGDDRAILVVNGPVSNGTGHTTAVDATCPTCSGAILRNIQVRCNDSSSDLMLTFISSGSTALGQAPHLRAEVLILNLEVLILARSLNMSARGIPEVGPACMSLRGV
jgi:hypothetical protein